MFSSLRIRIMRLHTLVLDTVISLMRNEPGGDVYSAL